MGQTSQRMLARVLTELGNTTEAGTHHITMLTVFLSYQQLTDVLTISQVDSANTCLGLLCAGLSTRNHSRKLARGSK